MSDKSDTLEGQLIRDRRQLMSPEPNLEEMGARFGWSDGKWGNIERGRSRARNGRPGRVYHPKAADLARIAAECPELGITPEDLDATGRGDAAAVLRRLLAPRPDTAGIAGSSSTPVPAGDPHAPCDELIGALIADRPDRDTLEWIWRNTDGDGRPRPREVRAGLIIDWLRDHAGGPVSRETALPPSGT